MKKTTYDMNGLTALARKAGAAIMEIYNENRPGTVIKEDGSPLTLADKASHDIITAGLAAFTPDVPVLSEESDAVAYEKRSGWSRFWIIDPLDGTKEFLKRNGEFTVNIALIENGSPVAGVVYAPAFDKMYFASKGMGAFRMINGAVEPISAGHGAGKIRVVASRSHMGEGLEEFIKSLGDVEVVNIGSSLKFCLVAEGSADIYPRFGPTMEWDTAAAHCIVEEAGGKVLDMNGDSLRYNKKELLNPYFIAICQGGSGCDSGCCEHH